MGWDQSYFPCDNCPVNNISWLNIQLFLTRLNDRTGVSYRLPTEAEWEFAAKGGNYHSKYLFSGSDDINEVDWYANNAKKKASRHGPKPNALGLYDMRGNLWELCQDDLNSRLYKGDDRADPLHIEPPMQGDVILKVTRGGAYEYSASESSITRRDGVSANVRLPDVGFRLARDIPM